MAVWNRSQMSARRDRLPRIRLRLAATPDKSGGRKGILRGWKVGAPVCAFGQLIFWQDRRNGDSLHGVDDPGGAMRTAIAVLVAMTALALSAARADETCRLLRMAELDIVTTSDGRITVPATIDGHPVRLLLDTAAPFSGVSPQWAAQNGEKAQTLSGNAVILRGGYRLNNFIQVASFQLGKLSTHKMSFSLYPQDYLPDVAGTLGADVLGGFDVDIDPASGRVNLFRRNGCGENVLYWDAEAVSGARLKDNKTGMLASQIFLEEIGDRRLLFDTVLDGKHVLAALDTGLPDTIMNLDRAREIFGWGRNAPPLKVISKDSYRYPFALLTFEGVEVPQPAIILVPESRIGLGVRPQGEALIMGMNMLRKLHIYISYGQRKVYFTGPPPSVSADPPG